MKQVFKQPLAVRIAIYAFLLICVVHFLVPIYIMVATSLKPMPEIRAGNALAWPMAPEFNAWIAAWSTACSGLDCNGVSSSFWNSVKITVPSVLISCLIGAITGYTLSFWRFKGLNLVYGVLLLVIFVPYQVFVFPLIQLSALVGFYGTLPGIILHPRDLRPADHHADVPQLLCEPAHRIDQGGAGGWCGLLPHLLPDRPAAVAAHHRGGRYLAGNGGVERLPVWHGVLGARKPAR